MKRLQIVLFLLAFHAAGAQTGQASFGVVILANNEATTGMNISMGIGNKYVTAGVNGDAFVFSKGGKFAVVSLDFRAYFSGLEKPVTPYFGFQPGLTLHSSGSGIIAVSFIGGVRVKPPKAPGGFLGVGYSNLGFKILNRVVREDYFKFTFGVAF